MTGKTTAMVSTADLSSATAAFAPTGAKRWYDSMNAWRMLALVALPALILAATATSGSATVVCNGSGDCFDYQCLPYDKNTLSTVPVEDVKLCLLKSTTLPSSADRATAIRLLTESCRGFGGTLKDGGRQVTCLIPAKATSAPAKIPYASFRTKTACVTANGVWDENKGGTCTDPRGAAK